jgi:hypothetical protein
VWFPSIKHLLHPFVYFLEHTLKAGMFKPVLSSVFYERKFRKAVPSDILVQVQ